MTSYGTADTQIQQTTDKKTLLNTIQTHLDKLITDMNIIKTRVDQTHRSSVNKITLIRGMVSEVLEEIEMEQRNMPMGTALSQEQIEAIEAVEAQEAQELLASLLEETGQAIRGPPGRGGIGTHRSSRRRRTTKRRR